MGNAVCGGMHENHLCQLVAREMGVEELKPLVRDAQYICRYCGRAAADAENLCRPEPLGEDEETGEATT